MDSDTSNKSYTLEHGVVKRVLEHGAYLELTNTGRTGYLHISALRDEFTKPPLSDSLRVGDVLSVAVRSFDPKHECWEVSHRYYEREHKLEILGLRKGERRVAAIQHATEIRCTVRIEQTVAYLSPTEHAWSKYRVLFESDRLTSGKHVEVAVGTWDPQSEGLIVHLPHSVVDDVEGEVRQAEVILLRSDYIQKKKDKFQSVLYASMGNDVIARVEITELLDIQSTFPVGSTVPIVVGKIDNHSGLVDAEIAWDLTPFTVPNCLRTGELREALVIWTSPNGVNCLIDNRVIGFIHKSSVIGSVKERLDKYLRPGDRVEVKVIEIQNRSKGRYKVKFLRMLDRFDDTEASEESNLVDLNTVRRTGTKGGFSREANFRWSVLDAYGHRCCICGLQFTIGEASAMEAAHVVPRSNRGSNFLCNALCLCPVHHWAFDKGLLTIDDELQVKVASSIRAGGDECSWLAKLHGQTAALSADAPLSRSALAWHRRNIFIDG